MSVFSVGPVRMHLGEGQIVGPNGAVPLTPIEQRLLGHLAEHLGESVPESELLREVWGYHPSVRSKAVQLAVSRLRKKVPALPLHTSARGYRLGDPPEGLEHRVWRLAGGLSRDPAALRDLEVLIPAVEAALGAHPAATEEALLRLAEAAWAIHRQLHRPAGPLWVLADTLASTDLALAAACALWAARLGAGSSNVATTREQLALWLGRLPDVLEHRRLRAEILLTLTNLSLHAGLFVDADTWGRTMLELGDRTGEPWIRATAIASLARVEQARHGPTESVRADLRDAATILRGAGEVLAALHADANLGAAHYAAGALVEAEGSLRRAIDGLRGSGLELDAMFASVNLGTVLLAQGRAEDAERIADEAIRAFAAAADAGGEAGAQLLRGRASAVRGRPALPSFDRALALARRHGRARTAAHALRYRGWALHYVGEVGGALDAYATPVGEAAAQAFVDLWRAWLGVGDAAVAEAALRERLGHAPWEARDGPHRVDSVLTGMLRDR